MSTNNLCFEQKFEKYQYLSEKIYFLVVKFSIYLNRRVFIMLLGAVFSLSDQTVWIELALKGC